MKRKIIKIDEKICNGCGDCIPNCPEGALQVIDGKVRLVSDLFCDGLGACIGHCPQGAITVEERDAAEYNETKVMENIVRQGKNVILAHLKHLKDHNEVKYLKEAENFLKVMNIVIPDLTSKQSSCSCPGSKVMDFRSEKNTNGPRDEVSLDSQLRQWPVQIRLVSPSASYFENADLLIAADCVPFAYANFHQDLLRDKILLVGCPKLDDLKNYEEKFVQIIKMNNIRSVTYVHMEVPCCLGMIEPLKLAIKESGKAIPFKEVTISIKGEKIA